MKKLLFIGAIGFAGMLSANDANVQPVKINENSEVNSNYAGGSCSITITRDNHDGTDTVVFTDVIYTETAEECQAALAFLTALAAQNGW